MKNIVIIGGGTGTFTLLSGLRKYPSNNSVIVSSADDGGSTGQLRKELGVFPPGDLRQCLAGLAYTDMPMTELFSYRFDKGSLAGHTVGNIIIAALEKTTGNIENAVEFAAKMLNVRGQVVPVTLKPTLLSAVLVNGKKIVGEHNIDEPNIQHPISNIKSLELKPNGPANPKALEAINYADAIIFGPGDLFTSTIPNLLVDGVKQAVNKSQAKKILVTNIMTKSGQTDGFKAGDFVKELEKYLGGPFRLGGRAEAGKLDVALVNNKKPAAAILAKYAKQQAKFVEPNLKSNKALTVVAENLLSDEVFKKPAADKLNRSLIRHDSDKLAKLIWGLI